MTASFTKTAPKRMSKAREAVAWVGGAVTATALAFAIYSLASAPFTTTVDSDVALPKELAITAQSATIRLPPVGYVDPAATTTTAAPAVDPATATTVPNTVAPATAETTAPAAQAPLGATTTAPTTAAPRPAATPTTSAPVAAAPVTTAPPATAAPTTAAPTTAAPATTTPVLPTPTDDATGGNDDTRGPIRDLLGGIFGLNNGEDE